jgi:hypothetical protein
MAPTYPELYSSIHGLGFVFLVLSLVLFYFALKVWRGLVVMIVNRPIITREIDLGKRPVPPRIQPLAQQLEALGMQLIGVEHSQTWLLGEAYTWIYLHPNGTVYAELIEFGNGAAAFGTWYPDNAYLHTAFPIGENIQRPDLHFRFAKDSVETAYHYHREQMNRWAAEHGQPVTFTNLREIMAYSKIYHERYRKRTMARTKRLGAINLGICLVLGVDMLVMAAQSLSDPPVIATAFGILFHAALLAGSVGLGLYVERQLKSPPGAIEV